MDYPHQYPEAFVPLTITFYFRVLMWITDFLKGKWLSEIIIFSPLCTNQNTLFVFRGTCRIALGCSIESPSISQRNS